MLPTVAPEAIDYVVRPGTVHVIVPCRPDHARHVEFFSMLLQLRLPPGSSADLYPGFFPHDNRCKGVRDALLHGSEYCFFLDDDQLLEPDTVLRLLSHGKDIVTVNLLTKEFPWQPYIFERLKGHNDVFPLSLENKRGLHAVDACGLGGVLVKTSVLTRLDYPWFNVNETWRTDDLYFCDKARTAGFEIHCDFDAISWHITHAAVAPEWNEETHTWQTRIRISSKGEVAMKAAVWGPDYEAWRSQQESAFEAELTRK